VPRPAPWTRLAIDVFSDPVTDSHPPCRALLPPAPGHELGDARPPTLTAVPTITINDERIFVEGG
jgi:hypothetical protein